MTQATTVNTTPDDEEDTTSNDPYLTQCTTIPNKVVIQDDLVEMECSDQSN